MTPLINKKKSQFKKIINWHKKIQSIISKPRYKITIHISNNTIVITKINCHSENSDIMSWRSHPIPNPSHESIEHVLIQYPPTFWKKSHLTLILGFDQLTFETLELPKVEKNELPHLISTKLAKSDNEFSIITITESSTQKYQVSINLAPTKTLIALYKTIHSKTQRPITSILSIPTIMRHMLTNKHIEFDSPSLLWIEIQDDIAHLVLIENLTILDIRSIPFISNSDDGKSIKQWDQYSTFITQIKSSLSMITNSKDLHICLATSTETAQILSPTIESSLDVPVKEPYITIPGNKKPSNQIDKINCLFAYTATEIKPQKSSKENLIPAHIQKEATRKIAVISSIFIGITIILALIISPLFSLTQQIALSSSELDRLKTQNLALENMVKASNKQQPNQQPNFSTFINQFLQSRYPVGSLLSKLSQSYYYDNQLIELSIANQSLHLTGKMAVPHLHTTLSMYLSRLNKIKQLSQIKIDLLPLEANYQSFKVTAQISKEP